MTKTGKNYQITTKLPNGNKIYQMAIEIYQHLSMQDTPKFTQIRIFGLKIYHLATLLQIIPIRVDAALSKKVIEKVRNACGRI
jgi:hypothetical protein